MTKKELFINEIEASGIKFSEDAQKYFETLKAVKEVEKPRFTENGKLILVYMQESKDSCNNIFKAKDIGEGMGISSRTVSGALRKLVTDNYVEKIGTNPTVYALTSKGIEAKVDEE